MKHSTLFIGMIAALAIIGTSATAQAAPAANDGPAESFFGSIGDSAVWVVKLITQPPADRVATQRTYARANKPLRYSRTKGFLLGH
ncbi:MAG: hypothetical protein AAGG38_09690 [Planctomycetota bacterium]